MIFHEGTDQGSKQSHAANSAFHTRCCRSNRCPNEGLYQLRACDSKKRLLALNVSHEFIKTSRCPVRLFSMNCIETPSHSSRLRSPTGCLVTRTFLPVLNILQTPKTAIAARALEHSDCSRRKIQRPFDTERQLCRTSGTLTDRPDSSRCCGAL